MKKFRRNHKKYQKENYPRRRFSGRNFWNRGNNNDAIKIILSDLYTIRTSRQSGLNFLLDPRRV
jgi:hypothetical protein